MNNAPAYSGKLLRELSNARGLARGLTWADNPAELAEIVEQTARELDALGPLAILIPVPRRERDETSRYSGRS